MKILVIGHVGFELMSPYLQDKDAEAVLVSPIRANFPQASKVYVYRSWTKHKPLVDISLKEKVDAVISISGPDMVNLRDSRLKEILEKNYGIKVLANPLAAVKIAVNKFKTKKWLLENDFPCPKGFLVKSQKEAFAKAAQLGFPLVFKSLSLAGGSGLQIAANSSEIPESGYPLLAEEYVYGREFSVEVLNYQGRTLPLLPIYKGKTNFEGLHPMERVKLAPAPLEPLQVVKLRQLAAKVVRKLNLQPTADIDFVWSKSGPQILEINPRFGGVTALSMVSSGILAYKVLVDMLFDCWLKSDYKFKRSLALELPTDINLNERLAKELLKNEGVFRIKIQKLKKTTGRIALRATSFAELINIIKKMPILCSKQNWQKEVELLFAETKAAGFV